MNQQTIMGILMTIIIESTAVTLILRFSEVDYSIVCILIMLRISCIMKTITRITEFMARPTNKEG